MSSHIINSTYVVYYYLCRYSKYGSHIQQCLPEKLASTRPAASSQPVNEAEPATDTVPLRTVGSSTDHHKAKKLERGSLSAENTVSAEGCVETPKAELKKKSTGSLSDQQAPGEGTHEQKWEGMLKETSTDVLF